MIKKLQRWSIFSTQTVLYKKLKFTFKDSNIFINHHGNVEHYCVSTSDTDKSNENQLHHRTFNHDKVNKTITDNDDQAIRTSSQKASLSLLIDNTYPLKGNKHNINNAAGNHSSSEKNDTKNLITTRSSNGFTQDLIPNMYSQVTRIAILS